MLRYFHSMAKGQRKVASDKSAIVAALPRACSDEPAAVEFMETYRWKRTGPYCTRCGDTDVYQMKDRKTGGRNKRFLWRCNGCKQQYTVRVGTVFEDSRIPLRHWCYAFWAASVCKKGVSALQIKRQTGLTYKSALFMMHRIRFAMAEDWTGQPKPNGIVEADETFVGGKPRNKHPEGRSGPRKGFLDKKIPVVALVQRDGQLRSFVTERVTANEVGKILRENVMLDSHLMTDSSPIYRYSLGKPFAQHSMTNHHAGEYARPGGIHSNTAESAFSLLKRGIMGTFPSLSRKHLRYVAEFDFRWNTRKIDDGERTAFAIQSAEGKRFRYKEPVVKVA
jgi:transposase-like protein